MCIYICVKIYIYVYIICIYLHIYTHICVYNLYMYVCIYVYIIYIHTYNLHTQNFPFLSVFFDISYIHSVVKLLILSVS